MARRRKPSRKKPAAKRAHAAGLAAQETAAPRPISLLALALGATLAIQPLVLHLFVTDEYETPKLIFLRCATCLVAAAWFATALRDGLPRHLKRTLLPLGAYLGVFAVSSAFSESVSTSLLGEYGSLAGLQSQLCYLAVCAAAATLVSARDVRIVLLFVLAGAVPSTGMALVEAAGHEIGTFFGMTAEIPRHTTSGTFGNANYFAGYTVSVIPAAVYLLRDRVLLVRLLAALVAAASAVAVFISGSRAGIVCLGLTVLWLPLFLTQPALLQRRREREAAGADQSHVATGLRGLLRRQGLVIGVAGLVIVAVGLAVAGPQVKRVGRSMTRPARSLTKDRTHLWGPALAMVGEDPLLGAGPDTYATVSPRYYAPRVYKRLGSTVTARRAHSEPLNVLACAGALGLAAWLWIFGGALWRGLRRARERVEGALGADAGLALGTALGLGLLFNSLHFITVGQAPWLFTLAGLLLGPMVHGDKADEVYRIGRPVTWVGAGAAAILLLFLTWDGASWIGADKQLKESIVASLRQRRVDAVAAADAAARARGFERRYREAAAQLHLRSARAGRAGGQSEDLEIARSEVAAALRLNRSPLALWIAATTEQSAGDVEAAAALAIEAMDRDPTRPGMLRKNLDWFVNRGKLEAVPEIFAPAFRQDPEGAAALALELGEMILPRLPVQTEPRARYLDLLVQLAEQAEQVPTRRDRAQALLERLRAARTP